MSKPKKKTATKGAKRLVLVEWVDSHSGDGWQPLDEIDRMAEPVYCRSVGWLVSQRDGVTLLVPHISGEKNDGVRPYGTGDMAIPDAAIVSLTDLRQQ